MSTAGIAAIAEAAIAGTELGQALMGTKPAFHLFGIGGSAIAAVNYATLLVWMV